jgi:predicted transcriptional regulator
MKTAKEEVRDLLEKIPENASFDDIQYHIYIRQKVQKGLEAAERGKVFSREEAERLMTRWTEK